MVKVFGLRSGGMLLEKATISWIMEGAEKVYAGSQQQIVLYLKVSKARWFVDISDILFAQESHLHES